MAVVTLPNGAKYNTSLDPNLPKPLSKVWTDTSYTGSNYIFTISYNYMNNHTYALKGTAKTFVIESK